MGKEKYLNIDPTALDVEVSKTKRRLIVDWETLANLCEVSPRSYYRRIKHKRMSIGTAKKLKQYMDVEKFIV